MQDKIDFLRSLTIFEGLTEQQLNSLAAICDPYTFEKGAVIAYQRDVARTFYMVAEGLLRAYEVDASGVVKNTTPYPPGTYLKDTWLFEEETHESTIRAVESGLLYTIRNDEFGFFLAQYPGVELDMSEAAWDEVDRSAAASVKRKFSRLNLLPGELIEYESRRTGLLLFALLSLPIVATVALPLLTAFFLFSFLSVPILWTLLASIFVMLFPLGFTLYRFWDWSNDYLLITNKHLVHTEFNLTNFSGQIIKIPIDQVQSVKVDKPSFVQTMLGVGTVRVSTAAQNEGLVFDYISAPSEVEDALSVIRGRQRSLDAGRTRARIRQTLEQHFTVPDQLTAAETGAGQVAARAQRKEKRRARRRGGRSEDGEVITYGRHWIVLAQLVWWLVILMVLTVAVPIGLWIFFPVVRIALTVIVTVVLFLIEAFAFFYFYEDWNNDLFQVTKDMVIDIDRGPFGFTESRKTAPLQNVQNVRAERPNFWAVIFGYGDVFIDTAGSSAEITFENVSNPNQIQSDIFSRRENVVRSRRERDAASRHKEFSLILDEYQQLREQDKIPDRTPPTDDLGEPIE